MKVIQEREIETSGASYQLVTDDGVQFFSTVIYIANGHKSMRSYANAKFQNENDVNIMSEIDHALNDYMAEKSRLTLNDHIGTAQDTLSLLQESISINDMQEIRHLSKVLMQNARDIEYTKAIVKSLQ